MLMAVREPQTIREAPLPIETLSVVRGDDCQFSRRGGVTRPQIWTLRVLCLVAIGITGYLAWAGLTSSKVVGCGSGQLFNCGHVLQTRWSKWFFLPVSVPALMVHLTALAALAFCSPNAPIRRQRLGWSVATLCEFTAGLAAVWFTALQLIVIRHLCVYCLVAHGCALAMAAVIVWKRPAGTKPTLALSAISLVLAGALIGGQLLATPPVTYEIQYHDNATSADDVFSPEAGGNESWEDGDFFEAPADEPQLPTSTPALEAPDETDHGAAPANLSRANTWSWLLLLRPAIVLSAQITQPSQSEAANRPSPTSGQQSAAGDAVKSVPDSDATPERRLVRISGNARLDVRQWPLLGSPKAKHVFVEMLDYTCPHCRNTHPAIDGAMERYGDDLALVVLPVPMNAACNDTVRVTEAKHAEACELARLAVAVWRVSPENFHAFHDWMLAGNRVPTGAEARQHAAQLVGDQALREELAKPVAAKYVAKHVELYKRAGAGTIPKLLFPRTTLVGEINSANRLVEILERELVNR